MRTGALRSARAAYSPPNPPPTITTCGSSAMRGMYGEWGETSAGADLLAEGGLIAGGAVRGGLGGGFAELDAVLVEDHQVEHRRLADHVDAERARAHERRDGVRRLPIAGAVVAEILRAVGLQEQPIVGDAAHGALDLD